MAFAYACASQILLPVYDLALASLVSVRAFTASGLGGGCCEGSGWPGLGGRARVERANVEGRGSKGRGAKKRIGTRAHHYELSLYFALGSVGQVRIFLIASLLLLAAYGFCPSAERKVRGRGGRGGAKGSFERRARHFLNFFLGLFFDSLCKASAYVFHTLSRFCSLPLAFGTAPRGEGKGEGRKNGKF
jgi:hypothetical protein